MTTTAHSVQADAEQAKKTGGMIALYPSADTLTDLVIPGGEPPEDMHVTLCYMGEDVTAMSSLAAQNLIEDIAMYQGPITARVFAHATFNPDWNAGREPCGVYLVSDSDDLAPLHEQVAGTVTALYEVPKQHSPWIPHITAGYGLTAADLSFTGEVVFDRISLEWAGHTFDYLL